MRLAILGGKPYFSTPPKEIDPVKEEHWVQAVKLLMKAGGGRGIFDSPLVEEFERAWAEYCGVKHAIMVGSGTQALILSLAALGIGPGDEVVVPAWTYTATAFPVRLLGAKIIWADICRRSWCLWLEERQIENLLTERTRAILAVDALGLPFHVQPLRRICRSFGLKLVEDAAPAHGAKQGEEMAGSLGDIAAFSFQSTKNLPLGEGGMVTTNDDELAWRVKLMRDAGELWMDGSPPWLNPRLDWEMLEAGRLVVERGFSFRPPAIQAALGLVLLPYLDEWNAQREEMALSYHQLFAQYDGLVPQSWPRKWVRHAFNRFLVKVTDFHDMPRRALFAALACENFPVSLYLQRPLAWLPHAVEVATSTIQLPIFVDYAVGEQLVACLQKVLDACDDPAVRERVVKASARVELVPVGPWFVGRV